MELDLLPWLRFLPNENFKKLRHARDLLDNWIDRELQEAKVRTYNESEILNSSIYTEYYLKASFHKSHNVASTGLMENVVCKRYIIQMF